MRTIILSVWGAIVALFGLFGVQIGLVTDINALPFIAALLVIGVWVVVELKQDWADFKKGLIQTDKWKDPAFWTAVISTVILPILGLFKIAIPDAIISSVALLLSIIIPFLIKPASPVSKRKLINRI